MPAWLKAGLIAGAFLIVVSLIGLIPVLGCIALPLAWVGYILAGVLAVIFLPPGRTAGQGAGQGALAAVVARLMSGVVDLVIGMLQFSSASTAEALAQIPPEQLQMLQQAGIDPALFTNPVFGGSALLICCGVGVVIAAVMGAIGGAITAAVKPE